jgi:23S rRNA pseudouridine1911/1915/1917 synthase
VTEPAGPRAPTAPVVFENEDLWIVDKPPGLVVHPAPGHRGTTLVEQLGADGGTALAVHRLDRDTSGLMIVARDPGARDELQGLIRKRKVEREYLALANGRLSARTGTIDAPLGRDARDRTRMAVREGGRTARTHFEVIEFLDRNSFLRARLETGRTHQIRAHFAAIGHPLAGDTAYRGGRELGLTRQFLHSARLRFTYSGSAEPIEVSSELPEDLSAALARARG